MRLGRQIQLEKTKKNHVQDNVEVNAGKGVKRKANSPEGFACVCQCAIDVTVYLCQRSTIRRFLDFLFYVCYNLQYYTPVSVHVYSVHAATT